MHPDEEWIKDAWSKRNRFISDTEHVDRILNHTTMPRDDVIALLGDQFNPEDINS